MHNIRGCGVASAAPSAPASAGVVAAALAFLLEDLLTGAAGVTAGGGSCEMGKGGKERAQAVRESFENGQVRGTAKSSQERPASTRARAAGKWARREKREQTVREWFVNGRARKTASGL